MDEYPVTEYRGFSVKPIVKVSETQFDGVGKWYEFTIHGWRGKKNCVVKGPGVYQTANSAAEAAVIYARRHIDEHIEKYKKSLFYRLICLLGYCPASKYNN